MWAKGARLFSSLRGAPTNLLTRQYEVVPEADPVSAPVVVRGFLRGERDPRLDRERRSIRVELRTRRHEPARSKLKPPVNRGVPPDVDAPVVIDVVGFRDGVVAMLIVIPERDDRPP